MNIKEICRRIEFHEGYRANPYLCTAGKKTIGIGRNLEARPFTTQELYVIQDPNNITREEAIWLLKEDIIDLIVQITKRIPVYSKLDRERSYALVDMCYQMGIDGVKKFNKMLMALDEKVWGRAFIECLDSKYAKDTPVRAKRIAWLLKTGEWIEDRELVEVCCQVNL